MRIAELGIFNKENLIPNSVFPIPHCPFLGGGCGCFGGFGGGVVTCGGRLYATTYAGKVSCLSEDGKTWQDAGQLAGPRFFHRMVCGGNRSLMVIGGGNMEEGKELTVEVVPAAFSH